MTTHPDLIRVAGGIALAFAAITTGVVIALTAYIRSLEVPQQPGNVADTID